MIKKYFIHLVKNWKVSLHSLGDFIVHFIHGLFPFIKIKHQQPKGKLTINDNIDMIIEEIKKGESL